ncbi:increased DNA methylation 1-like isoform X1 [Zingiber officinale]|uniref:increased DNA methylation 1-like isoform X1 n=1 Tax=Zingiber officinale TaxID=94328 RepID=UPI001C4D7FC1|nr:increased DNA methylation 1-like isoform X1 [Zingiber officinale]
MIEWASTVIKGSKTHSVMSVLLGHGTDAMTDEFDGSKGEKDIFMEIFNLSADKVNNLHVASNLLNFPKDKSIQSRSLASMISESSGMTTYVSLRDSSSNTSQPQCISDRDVSRSRCLLESSSTGSVSDHCDVQEKRMNLSIEQHNQKGVTHSSSLLVSSNALVDLGQLQNSSSMFIQHQEQLQCLVVESCGQGILSSCYLSQTHEEIDASNNMDDDVAPDIEFRGQEVRDANIINEAKSVTSPVSQESCAYDLLVINSTSAHVETLKIPTCMKQLNIVKSDRIEVASKKALIRDLPERLCSHANCLLTDAGWKIAPRVRNDRAKLASYYVPPEGKPVLTSLSQAWKACGRRLHSSARISDKDDKGGAWANIGQFWSDLTDTLFYIDENTQPSRTSISHLKRWQLLDPFVAVVYINRKISLLREGKSLKAVNSCTFVLAEENNNVLADDNVVRVSHLGKLNSSSGSYLNPNIQLAGHDQVLITVIPKNQKNSQNCLDWKTNAQCNQQNWKISCASGVGRGDLSSLSVSKGTNMHDATCLHPSCKELTNSYNTVCGSNNISIFTEDVYPTSIKDFSVFEFSVDESLPYVLETPLTNGPEACKASSFEKSVCQQLSSRPSKCKSVKKDLKEARQKRTIISAKRRVYGKHLSKFVGCDTLDLPSHENTANKMEVDDEHLKIQHSTSRPGCKGVIPVVDILNFFTTEKAAIEDQKSNGLDFSLSQASGSGKKTHKKSKKKSGIKTYNVDGTCYVKCTKALGSHFNQKIKNVKGKKENIAMPFQNKAENSLVHSNADVSCTVGETLDTQSRQIVTKLKEAEVCKKNRWKRPRGFRINDDDLLIAAIIKNKDYVTCIDTKGSKLGVSQPKKLKKLESQKGGCKLLLRTPGKGALSKDGKEIILGARTVLSWLIERGVLSLKDVFQYRNPKNNDLVKDGLITRNGILCRCCEQIFSLSAFKCHSGSKLQKPSSNLFLESGRSYTLCQLQAWSAEYKARKSHMRDMGLEEVDQNDDTCGFCVDGGELICCDNCPSTYHQTCLTMRDLPEGSWYCHNCICKSCGNVVKATKEHPRPLAVLECSQCEHKYHYICIKKKDPSIGEVKSGSWFCGENCEQVYLGLRSRVGILNGLADGFSWTILRCNHDDQKINSTQKIALMAECNMKLAIALSIMEECFLPMVDPRTGINMIPHVLYNRGSNFTRLNYQGFYTVVMEKNDEIISVASLRIHGITVAEIPLIATSSEHRRQGMCRRLLNAVEKTLKSFKVKMLVLSAIPGLVETWTSHFGFKSIGDIERRQLNHVNFMLFPGTELLIKNLEDTTEETGEVIGSDDASCSRVSQSSCCDDTNKIDVETTVQTNEISGDDADRGAFISTMNGTHQIDHKWQQKGLFIQLDDTPNSTSKPDDNKANISESFCINVENLNNQVTRKFNKIVEDSTVLFTPLK